MAGSQQVNHKQEDQGARDGDKYKHAGSTSVYIYREAQTRWLKDEPPLLYFTLSQSSHVRVQGVGLVCVRVQGVGLTAIEEGSVRAMVGVSRRWEGLAGGGHLMQRRRDPTGLHCHQIPTHTWGRGRGRGRGGG